jgi:predicted permease
METLLQDIRYALRQLRKNPGFAGITILILALGIGANTAIFSVVNALLLRLLPVTDPQQLVVVGNPAMANSRSQGTPRTDIFSYPLYKELRDRNSVFSGLCAAATDHHIELAVGEGAPAEVRLTGRMVSGNYFNVLGLEAAAGRLFSDDDDTAENANPVVVLGYRYWQRKFALSAAIVGKDILLNGSPFTVVGVAPAAFEGDVVGQQMALYVPLSMQPAIVRGRHWRTSGNSSWLSLIGRLKPGVTAAQAEANLNIVFQQAAAGDYGAALSADDRKEIHDSHMGIHVASGGGGISSLRGEYRLPLLLLMGIVALVLLISCVNVANLLLARAQSRSREMAVRMAIGANRPRVLRQLLTESVLLALFGGMMGTLLAILGVRLLIEIIDSDAVLPVHPDWRVLLFTLLVSALTGVVFGLVPAMQSSRIRVSPALKDSGSIRSGSASRFTWGKRLTAAQVAISLVVLFAACLLVRSLQKLMAQDFGYSRNHLVIARLDPTAAGYDPEKMKVLAQELAMRLSSVSGVRDVTYSANGLFAGHESNEAIIVPGFHSSDRSAGEDYVGADYFKVVGIPILSGRGIEAQDTATSTLIAVVNEAMAKHFFEGQNPVGRQFRIDDPDWLDKPITIVGVSHNAKDHGNGIRKEVGPRFYFAFQQVPDPEQIVIEAQVIGPSSAATASLQKQIKAVDSRLPISFVQTLDQLVEDSAGDQISLARLSEFFAGLGLLLACIGLYGVLSYTVAGRTREIGVRMALGAQRRNVLQLVLREAMVMVVSGLVIGIPLAFAASRVLGSFLFGLKGTDLLSLILVLFLLSVVAGVAGFIPARRAARVDPMVALRYE